MNPRRPLLLALPRLVVHDLDVRKPGIPHPADVHLLRLRPRQACHPVVRVVQGMRGQRRCQQHIRYEHPAARLQNARRLPEHRVLVRREINHAVGYNHIHRPVLNRRAFHLCQVKLHIVHAQIGGVGARQVYHIRRHIDADDPAALAHRFGGDKAVYPPAAAEIHHRLARVEIADSRGIAAARRRRQRLARQPLDLLHIVQRRNGFGQISQIRRNLLVAPAAPLRAAPVPAIRRHPRHLSVPLPHPRLDIRVRVVGHKSLSSVSAYRIRYLDIRRYRYPIRAN